MSARTGFDQLLTTALVPEFCSDPSRLVQPSGFNDKSNRVSDEDAQDFLRLWNANLVLHQGRGLYLIGASKVREQFFWSGAKSEGPRTFTLWMEPVITVGAIARLHFDFGWPFTQLGAQSKDWAYDIVAVSSDMTGTIIAGEVKKSRKEIDDWVGLMLEFGSNPDAPVPLSGKRRNA